MKAREITVGLDVGTTKASVVVAEVDETGALSILGLGDRPCEGLERGMVVNLEATTTAVAEAVKAAEQMAGVPIKSLLCGIAGEHVASRPSTGIIGVSRKDREITEEDLRRVLEAARTVAIPGDQQMLHCLPRGFAVDGQKGIRDPLGMTGIRLEALVQIVTVHTTAVQNLLRAVTRAGVGVDALVLEPLASARAVLADDEMDLGVLLLDIGGGTTDIVVYEAGAVTHAAVLGYGGKTVTNDLAIGLRTPVEQAERLKVEYGSAIEAKVPRDASVEVPGVGGREPRLVSAQVMAGIIEDRVEEMLRLAQKEVESALNPSILGAGVVLTGGTACLHDITELAERVLGLPARVGVPEGMNGVSDLATDPRFASCIGLVRYAAAEGRTRRVGSKLLDRMRRPLKEWFKEYF